MTEAWFRNPSHFVRELAEVGYARMVWHRGKLKKLGIDPKAHADLYFAGRDYRALVLGEQGAMELRPDSTAAKPTAVYPVWSYELDNLVMLEELLAHPVGEDPAAYGDKALPPDERPVQGQEHRVVVINLPPMNAGPGRRIARQLSELQREYPESIIHVSGLYGYRIAFGMGFGAVDLEPREAAAKGKVALPMGREIKHEQSARYGTWLSLLGYTPGDLEVPRNRCIFNIKSALWASENYDENVRFRVRRSHREPNVVNPDVGRPSQTLSYRTGSSPVKPGDMMLCNTCSIQTECKYFREGAVCSVQGSQTSGLARLFSSRNADQVVSGLSQLMSMQSERLERGMAQEEVFEEIDPEVTKIANGLFTNGVKLAKLLNPELTGARTQVGVVVNTGQGQVGTGSVSTADPRALTAGFVAELEAQGIPRDKITPKMLESLLNGDGDAAARAAQVVDVEER